MNDAQEITFKEYLNTRSTSQRNSILAALRKAREQELADILMTQVKPLTLNLWHYIDLTLAQGAERDDQAAQITMRFHGLTLSSPLNGAQLRSLAEQALELLKGKS